jgi:hypothetical protein
MFPVAEWLDDPTLRGVSSHLLGGPLVGAGWIRGDAVRTLVAEHAGRRADHHVRLWQLMSLDAWHRRFLHDESAEDQCGRLAHTLEPLAHAATPPVPTHP